MQRCLEQVCQVHERLPPGGILVFLTGQREVEELCKRLRTRYSSSNKTQTSTGTQGMCCMCLALPTFAEGNMKQAPMLCSLQARRLQRLRKAARRTLTTLTTTMRSKTVRAQLRWCRCCHYSAL